MSVLAISGQTLRIKRQALDAAGVECYKGGGASTNFNDYKFIDDTNFEWEVKSFSGWDVNGEATFDLKIPTVTTPETRVINRTYKGGTFNFTPDSLVVNLFVPYQGKFDLTNALVASDCTPNLEDLSYLPDYSGHHMNLGRYDGNNLNHPFTKTSQYRTEYNGPLITLGRDCVGQGDYTDQSNMTIREAIYREDLCIGRNSLPPKVGVVEGIFNWVPDFHDDIYTRILFIRLQYKLKDSGVLRTVNASLEYTGNYDPVSASTQKISLSTGNGNGGANDLAIIGGIIVGSPLRLFCQRQMIVHIALRIEWNDWDSVTMTGIPTISLYINGIKRVMYTLPAVQTDNDITWRCEYLPVGIYTAQYCTSWYYGYDHQIYLAMLDFAAYPSTHTDEQILNNAKAWGLA